MIEEECINVMGVRETPMWRGTDIDIWSEGAEKEEEGGGERERVEDLDLFLLQTSAWLQPQSLGPF